MIRSGSKPWAFRVRAHSAAARPRMKSASARVAGTKIPSVEPRVGRHCSRGDPRQLPGRRGSDGDALYPAAPQSLGDKAKLTGEVVVNEKGVTHAGRIIFGVM